MNILVVDDEKSIREGMKRTLNQTFPHFQVMTVHSCQDAILLLLNERIHVLLLDIRMPGMNGLELLAALQRSHRGTKVVIISAHSKFAYAQEALRLGVKDYLVKPVGKEQLIRTMSLLEQEWADDMQQLSEKDWIHLNLNYLREAVFRRWVQGLDIGRFDVSRLAEKHPYFHLVFVQLEGKQDISLHHFVVENVLTEWFAMNGQGFIVSLEGNRVLGVVTLREEVEAACADFERGARAHLERCLNEPYQFVMSRRLTDFHAIPQEVNALLHGGAALVQQELPARKNDDAVEIALQYIAAHFQENLSLEKIASIVYLNPVYFSQLFKHKLGIGYKEYVTQLRMERAQELLANRALRITDVAKLVGYDDLRHFTQVFRKKFQVTPSDYRLELS
ncbi:response regulator [Paenibacillus rigui]|uniref:DNA-binding response regulator n=1 Tax=Paenibacillus rigui TaxID=554312 RepID=A0A229UQC6_9BACL|nr:response regulator [Paenibacillus rigui]OXM85580.1 DNA-binding response regulator [Paenibacillus rigui]